MYRRACDWPIGIRDGYSEQTTTAFAIPLDPQVAERAFGLSDPNRVRLALLVRACGSACVSDLADLTGIEPSVVSRHLIRLREAGLSESRRRGKLSLHSLTPDGERLLAALAGP
jgi:DNA-binding transcriptional ArsR family regulator